MARKQREAPTNCASAGLGRGRRAVAGKKEAGAPSAPPGGSSSGHQQTRATTLRAPIAAQPPPLLRGGKISPSSRGRGLRPLPLLPALPCPARLSPIRFGPARPSPRHSRLRQLRRLLPCPGFSPTHSRLKQRRRIRAARGLAGRNTWGLCSRNRKPPFPPPLRRAGAVLGSRRFGSLYSRRGLRLLAPWDRVRKTSGQTASARTPASLCS